MNKRDIAKLNALLLELTARFSDPHVYIATIGRGDARAIIAMIRERSKWERRS